MQINGIISRVTNGRRSSVNQLYSSQLFYSLFFLCPPTPTSNNCSCSSVVWVNTCKKINKIKKKSLQFSDEEQKRRLRKKGLLTSVTVQTEKNLISKKLHYNLGKQIIKWYEIWSEESRPNKRWRFCLKTKQNAVYYSLELKKEKRSGGR